MLLEQNQHFSKRIARLWTARYQQEEENAQKLQVYGICSGEVYAVQQLARAAVMPDMKRGGVCGLSRAAR